MATVPFVTKTLQRKITRAVNTATGTSTSSNAMTRPGSETTTKAPTPPPCPPLLSKTVCTRLRDEWFKTLTPEQKLAYKAQVAAAHTSTASASEDTFQPSDDATVTDVYETGTGEASSSSSGTLVAVSIAALAVGGFLWMRSRSA